MNIQDVYTALRDELPSLPEGLQFVQNVNSPEKFTADVAVPDSLVTLFHSLKIDLYCYPSNDCNVGLLYWVTSEDNIYEETKFITRFTIQNEKLELLS